jgi:hypothetical protein
MLTFGLLRSFADSLSDSDGHNLPPLTLPSSDRSRGRNTRQLACWKGLIAQNAFRTAV